MTQAFERILEAYDCQQGTRRLCKSGYFYTPIPKEIPVRERLEESEYGSMNRPPGVEEEEDRLSHGCTITNWDKLEDEDPQGLLVSLINMKRYHLDVVEEILDTQLTIREGDSIREPALDRESQTMSEREKLLSPQLAPKVDITGSVHTLAYKFASPNGFAIYHSNFS